ncbi:MAG: phosphoesterase [Aquificae bacterium]|nr:phosphoesterase [Aquificota bacterium]
MFILILEFRPVKRINLKEKNILTEEFPTIEPNFNIYRVITHIHTQFSFDSLGKPSDIKKAMEINKIDFVFVTDHNNTDYKCFEDDKIFAGIEKNTDDGRLLLLGGVLPVISHPHNFEFEHYKWKGDFKKEYLYEIIVPKDAFVWNKKLAVAVFLKNLLIYPFTRRIVHKWNSFIPLEEWTKLYFSRARGENLIGGLDLHIKLVYQEHTHGPMFPSYKDGFRWLQNVVLSKKDIKSKKDILNALSHGNLYISINENYGEFFAIDESQNIYTLGDSIPLSSVLYCKIKDKKRVIFLKRENEPVIITDKKEFHFKTKEKGFYHFEIYEYDFKIGNLYFGFRPVIITNFFKVEEI